MKTIINVWGTGQIGKTSAVKAVFDRLKAGNKHAVLIAGYDIKATVTYKNKLIGIESAGDPGSRQGDSLLDFIGMGCDIIICASRTKGTTLNNVLGLGRANGYEILLVSLYSNATSAGPNTSVLPGGLDLNSEFSAHMIELIDKL